jgi:hypothetical protein
MKKTIFIILILAGCINLFPQTGQDAILPSEKEVPGWRTSGELKKYTRENVNTLLSEETDLFKEFGLKSVISRDYYNFSGKTINIRVFTMDNSFGSYGIFLQKSKGEKVFKEFGNACFENKGNFQFWKQLYFVVMHSEFSGDTISQGFRQIAGIIDSKIKSRGILPDILKLSGNRNGTTSIFKGPLGLANIYYFGPLNIFNVNEGIAIENKDTKEIILRYKDNNECVRRFSDAAGILGGMQKFTGFTLVNKYEFTMKDNAGKELTFKVDKEYLNIVIK